MFGIGVSELLVIFLVALLVLGPEKLPQAARTMAKLFGEFRQATDDLRSSLVSVTEVEEEDDFRKRHNAAKIVDAKKRSAKAEEEKEANSDEIIEPQVIARGSENIHG